MVVESLKPIAAHDREVEALRAKEKAELKAARDAAAAKGTVPHYSITAFNSISDYAIVAPLYEGEITLIWYVWDLEK